MGIESATPGRNSVSTPCGRVYYAGALRGQRPRSRAPLRLKPSRMGDSMGDYVRYAMPHLLVYAA